MHSVGHRIGYAARVSEAGRVVVAGGGVAGCAAAYYLSAAGVPVTLVERAGVGAQASAWSAGGINPLHGIPAPLSALAMESFRLHLGLWPEMQRLSGIDFAPGRIAMVMLAPDAAAVPALLAQGEAFGAAEGFSATWLDPAALTALEPRLTAPGAGALLTRGNGVLDSHRLTLALAAAAQRNGARLHAGAVSGIEGDGRRVGAVRCGPDVLPCAAVVFALGPWSQGAAGWLGAPLPVEPLKGEILRLDVPGPPLPFDVVAPAVSLFVRRGGQVWAGTTSEARGFDAAPSEFRPPRVAGGGRRADAVARRRHPGAADRLPAPGHPGRAAPDRSPPRLGQRLRRHRRRAEGGPARPRHGPGRRRPDPRRAHRSLHRILFPRPFCSLRSEEDGPQRVRRPEQRTLLRAVPPRASCASCASCASPTPAANPGSLPGS